ncbi:hypothetical protein [Mesorhizobium sp. M7A.F.Ca.US.011.01.1.1]|uniref:hypothetical protein n=1 Tax=Mesorhizobium sp. M7A.F.Ca.US.011.01.1.1 TaxID=2496741 RepID=UPI0019D05E43|nr:hypothetical protein [Mesorhizobium sp. M7A.F.Ca.US.011.01.1.1]
MRHVMLGALAGLAATMAMTSAMRRFHGLLNGTNRYPLPPREIVDRLNSGRDERQARTNTLFAHFGFGAITGAVFALLPRHRGSGILYGLGVWTASYLGWIPAARILAPAWRHPAERNLLMIAVHIVWGTVLAKSLSELEAAEAEAFGRPADAELSVLERRERGTGP